MTNTMERKGNVYPYVKSGVLGYGYGHEREEDWDGVCSQIAPDCGGWWGHLETVNKYEGGAITRKAAQSYTRSGDIDRSSVDPSDPLVWNNMRVEQLAMPKVFLCKAGLFLEKLNENMGGDGVVKEKFGPEEFQHSCDPRHLGKNLNEAHAAVAEAAQGGDDDPLDLDDVEIIAARDEERKPLFPGDNFRDLPVLVFEGLPKPTVDQSEAELVESVLSLVDIPVTSVRTAVRLPVRTRGKSIVLVEMDTEQHREDVIENKTELREELGARRSSLISIGIRKAKYRELWKYVRQLLVAKEILENEKGENEESEDEEEEEENEDEEPLFLEEDENKDEEIIEEDGDDAEIVEVKEEEPK